MIDIFQGGLYDLPKIPELKITHIISIVDKNKSITVPNFSNKTHLVLHFDDVVDSPESPESPNGITVEQVQEIISFVTALPKNAKLFVHCNLGVSRSTAVVTGIKFLLENKPKNLLTKAENAVICALESKLGEKYNFWPSEQVLDMFDRVLQNKNGELLNIVAKYKETVKDLIVLPGKTK